MFELIIKMGDRTVQEYRGTKEIVNIGRDPGCDVVLDNLGISRQHAQIRKVEDRFVLTDTDSTNGVVLNDRPIKSMEIQSGDTIDIGKFSMVFQIVQGAPGEQAMDVNETIFIGGADSPVMEQPASSLVASVTRPVFHRPDCGWIQGTPTGSTIYFNTVDEAINSGRRPCRSCWPDE